MMEPQLHNHTLRSNMVKFSLLDVYFSTVRQLTCADLSMNYGHSEILYVYFNQ